MYRHRSGGTELDGIDLFKVCYPGYRRGMLGYVDFAVDDYSSLRERLVGVHGSLVEGDGWEMIEVSNDQERVIVYFPDRPLSADLTPNVD